VLCRPQQETICSSVCDSSPASHDPKDKHDPNEDRDIEVLAILGPDAEAAEEALSKASWRIHLDRTGFDQLGMYLYKGEAAMLVTSINPDGAVEAYNETCKKGTGLTPGTFIIGANGVFGKGDDLLTAMSQADDDLELVLSAKQPFLVSMDLSKKKKVGIVIGILAKCLLIKEVLEGGAMWKWNEQFPASRVLSGDLLIQVNDIHSDGVRLLQALQEGVQLDLFFRR